MRSVSFRAAGCRVAFAAGGWCALAFLACAAAADGPVLSVPELTGCRDLKARIASFYAPVTAAFTPNAPAYALPLKLDSLTNADHAANLVKAPTARALLSRNGFAVADYGRLDDVVAFYKSLRERGLPVFVTSDSLLHLYHVQFDETLKSIEEREFSNDALQLSKALQGESLRLCKGLDGDAREAARRTLGYATVALELLAEDTLRERVIEARDFARAWKGRHVWQLHQQMMQKYPEVMKTITTRPARGQLLSGPAPMNRPEDLHAALDRYLKTHPGGRVIPTTVPPEVAADVAAELKLIAAHQGFAGSPLFHYKEDYSQYVPRGHYTRSEILKRYFKALMWYGRMTFIIKGSDRPADRALVSEREARVQTMAAVLLASMLDNVKVSDGRTLARVWDRMYSVTAYYVGFADDLTPYEYRGALREVYGVRPAVADLNDAQKWLKFRAALARLRSPEIYSGTGDIEGPPAAIADENDLMKALASTKGMRLMGQRYIPDSYMMGRLVYPTVGRYEGKGKPFTLVISAGGPIRGFPRGLDVMAVLGAGRARAILRQLGDDRYARYDTVLAKLRHKFGALSAADWNRNLYWSWLYALRALLADYGKGYPTFMQTPAWHDKQLNAALGSWSQLRHDTILYAKQSYTMKCGAAPMQPKMVEGYVEPVPEFYARLLALTRMTRKGLGSMQVLDHAADRRLQSLEQVVERLLALSKKELAGQRLSDQDYDFIRFFGERLKGAVAGVAERGLETTIVADVHTDANSRHVLEEGTGHLRAAFVAYPMPDGGVVLGAGPVFSYYEFKHPMADRLTDEAWKALLRKGGAPASPAWTSSFSAP